MKNTSLVFFQNDGIKVNIVNPRKKLFIHKCLWMFIYICSNVHILKYIGDKGGEGRRGFDSDSIPVKRFRNISFILLFLLQNTNSTRMFL